jgi:hypothetical protein
MNKLSKLQFVDFAYNNGYQASLKMTPFKVLYGICNVDGINDWAENAQGNRIGGY